MLTSTRETARYSSLSASLGLPSPLFFLRLNVSPFSLILITLVNFMLSENSFFKKDFLNYFLVNFIFWLELARIDYNQNANR